MGNKPSNEKLFTTKSLNLMAKNNKNYILFIALSAALGGLLFGYDTAVISGAIGNLTEFFHLSPVETGWAISSALVGCLIGAFFSDFLSDTFGRKVTMLITAILFILNSVGTAFPTSFTMFVLFRIVGGIGVGIASMVVPMYIAEIAPPKRRGALVGNYQLAIVIGIVVVYFVNYLSNMNLLNLGKNFPYDLIHDNILQDDSQGSLHIQLWNFLLLTLLLH